MNNTKHYLDEDFQHVLDGTFSGDLQLFNAHCRICRYCGAQLTAFEKTRDVIVRDNETYDTTPIIGRVWKRVHGKKEVDWVDMQYRIVLFLGSALIVFCLTYLVSQGLGLGTFSLLALVIVGFCWISLKEIEFTRSRNS